MLNPNDRKPQHVSSFVSYEYILQPEKQWYAFKVDTRFDAFCTVVHFFDGNAPIKMRKDVVGVCQKSVLVIFKVSW